MNRHHRTPPQPSACSNRGPAAPALLSPAPVHPYRDALDAPASPPPPRCRTGSPRRPARRMLRPPSRIAGLALSKTTVQTSCIFQIHHHQILFYDAVFALIICNSNSSNYRNSLGYLTSGHLRYFPNHHSTKMVTLTFFNINNTLTNKSKFNVNFSVLR